MPARDALKRTLLAAVLSWLAVLPAAGLADELHADSPPLRSIAIQTQTALLHFKVEQATTPAEKSRGLMHRRQLAAGQGMLFHYQPPRAVNMWMKNTQIPLDILFIDTEQRITRIAKQTRPNSLERIPSEGIVRFVLEINAGLTSQQGISVGDRLLFTSD